MCHTWYGGYGSMVFVFSIRPYNFHRTLTTCCPQPCSPARSNSQMQHILLNSLVWMARHGWHVGIELSVVGLRFNRNVLLQKMGRDGNMRLSGWNLRGSPILTSFISPNYWRYAIQQIPCLKEMFKTSKIGHLPKPDILIISNYTVCNWTYATNVTCPIK